MCGYHDIQDILDRAVDHATIGQHGAFWRNLTRDEFVTFRVFGQVPLLLAHGSGFDPDNSNLVKALEGRSPFGRDTGTPGAQFRRMPAGRPAVSAKDIQTIREWISAGCPA
jgi:hypothetical protein